MCTQSRWVDNGMEQEHGTVWQNISKDVELAQKISEESTVTALKTQVSKIDSFAKKIDSGVRDYINRLKDPTYTFI